MKLILAVVLSLLFAINVNGANTNNTQMPVLKWAEDLLYAARLNEDTDSLRLLFQKISVFDLNVILFDDNTKKAFWLNIYNALVVIDLKANPDAYKNRNTFFTKNRFDLLDLSLSLDDIEHKLLRKSKIKWAFGYLNRWFPRKWEKLLRVNVLDYRVHFALNCGAESCPPIAYYEAVMIDKQLELAAYNFVVQSSIWNEQKQEWGISKIFFWFRGDFGGKKGLSNLLNKLLLTEKGRIEDWHYLPYNWALNLH